MGPTEESSAHSFEQATLDEAREHMVISADPEDFAGANVVDMHSERLKNSLLGDGTRFSVAHGALKC